VKDHQTQLNIETQAAQQSSLLGVEKEGCGIMVGGPGEEMGDGAGEEMGDGALGWRDGAQSAG